MRSSDSILLLFLSRKEVKHIPFMLVFAVQLNACSFRSC